MRNFILLILGICLVSVLRAHPNSHKNYNDRSSERAWYLEDKAMAATGSFLFVKNEKVYLETAKGIKSYKIESLSEADQKYISEKQRIVDPLNGQWPAGKAHVDEASFIGDALPYTSWLAAILLAIYLRVDFKRNRNKASIIGLFFIFSFSIYLVSNHKINNAVETDHTAYTETYQC